LKSKEINPDDLWNAFLWGIDYGQLLMEEERESEELFDAAVCYTSGLKFCVPSVPVRRRQLHSEKWFAVKRCGYIKFMELYNKFYPKKDKSAAIEQKGLFD
jgi:hypothetical protein